MNAYRPGRPATPTPFEGVNRTLSVLQERLKATLREQFVALYLGGSLALGDYVPERSNIDFVVVTRYDLSNGRVAALRQMHDALRESGGVWAERLHGSYVSRRVIRDWNPDHPPCPLVARGELTMSHHESAIVERHLLREYGIPVYGPTPYSFMLPVPADELREAVRAMLQSHWRPLLDDPEWLHAAEHQRAAIIAMCRALFNLAHGDVVSKPAAARWVRQMSGARWDEAIQWALLPAGGGTEHLHSTMDLVRYTLDQADSMEGR